MDNLVVSYSKMKSWRFCKQNYHYKYIQKIVPKRKPKPLKMGSLIHDSLKLKETTGKWEEPIKAAVKEYNKMFQEEKELYGNFPEDAKRIMEGYIRKYRKELYKFHHPETSFGPIPLTDITSFYFIIDKMAEPLKGPMRGDLFLWETKTGKKLPTDDMRIWDLQTVIYVWGLRELGFDVKGIIWDYLRTKAPAIPEMLKNGGLSQRKNIDTDYFTYFQAIREAEDDPSNYQEILEMLKEKEDNFFKRITVPISDSVINSIVEDARNTSLEIYYLSDTPVKSISGYTCPRCDYKSLCYAQLRGLDEDFIRKAEFVEKAKTEEDMDERIVIEDSEED